MKKNNTIKIAVHSGIFHSDDVFVVAIFKMLAKFLNVEIIIERINDDDVNNWNTECGDPFKGIIADIGGGRYDHHQYNYEVDDDIEKKVPCHHSPYQPIPKAAIGLIWSDFGTTLVSIWLYQIGLADPTMAKQIAGEIEKDLIVGISANDNGVFEAPKPFVQNATSIINDFRPTWQEDNKTMDEAFYKAVDFAQGILTRHLKKVTKNILKNKGEKNDK